MDNSKTKKVLLVEDEKDLIFIYQQAFSTAGITLLIAEDKLTALEIIKKEKPKIILLDLIIPSSSESIVDFSQKEGFNLLEEAKEEIKENDIKVLVLSNLVSKEAIERSKELGALDFIVKSKIIPDDLADKILRLLI